MSQPRFVYGEKLITSYHPERTTTMPRTYSADYVRGLEDLIVRASARYAALKDKYDVLASRVQAMQAKKSPTVQIMQAFGAPQPPSVLEEVVKLQKARGQR